MTFGLLALITAAVFSGAAVYITIAEQPARLKLDDRALLTEWKPSYARGFSMQASLAVIGFAFGMLAWWTSGRTQFLAGALTLVANWPYTLLAIMPVNDTLNAIPLDNANADTRALIIKWGKLHAVRGLLGCLATALFFWALV